jgi:hypothetical protein
MRRPTVRAPASLAAMGTAKPVGASPQKRRKNRSRVNGWPTPESDC